MTGSFELQPEAVPPEAGALLDPEVYGGHYRELAENLRALDGAPGRVAVTGVGDGVGCSSVCLGLGGALASLGVRAAVLDCDLHSPRLHQMLGEPNFTGLTTAQREEGSLENHGYEPISDLLVVPTGPIPEDPASALEPERVSSAVGELRESRDVVILDSPGRQESEEFALYRELDGVLLVIHASLTSKSEAREAARELEDSGVNLLGVVLNGVR